MRPSLINETVNMPFSTQIRILSRQIRSRVRKHEKGVSARHLQLCRVPTDVTKFNTVLQRTKSQEREPGGAANYELTPSIQSLYSPCEAMRTWWPSALRPLHSAMSGKTGSAFGRLPRPSA